MKKGKEFSDVSITTVDMINTYTSANLSTENAEGGNVDMCKGLQDLIEEERTIERTESTVQNIRNIMKNLKLTAEQAVKAVGIEESEQAKYIAML